MQLNLLLALAGIVLSLPIGILLALGRRSHLPVVKTLCVVFIEVFRGVPLITLLFMSQHLVPLAFSGDVSQELTVQRRCRDYDVQFRVHGGEHPRGAAGAASGAGRGGTSLRVSELADDAVHFTAPGHSERDSGHRGQFISLF